MAVTAAAQDTAGKILDGNITSMNSAITAATAGSVQAQMLADKLRNAQLEAVLHYLQVGRIQPATILSTLS